MYEMRLRRHTYCTDRTIGTLVLPCEERYATLEPPLVADAPCIPKGRYKVTIYKSPKFKSDVLLLHDVPGRSAIEIHKGNYPKDTRGCILVGLRHDQYLRFSATAMVEIMGKVKAAYHMGHEIWIRIE